MSDDSDGQSGPITMLVGPDEAGGRIDRWLAARIAPLTRSRIQGLIREGAVRVGAVAVTDPGHKIRPGDVIRVEVPEPIAAEPGPETIPLTILYEDAHLIVVDKPAGLVVHPAAGHATGTLVNALMAHCGASLSGIGGVRRPGIVHRLDKDTSGLLVVAKTDLAHQGLSAQFAAHGRDGRLHRRYRAIVWGVPSPQQGRIEAPLGRSPQHRTRMAVVRVAGRMAVTHYAVDEIFTDNEGKSVASLVSLLLETGRTHQIRVHMEHIGHPLLADATYGAGFKASARRLSERAQAAIAALGRQALHAAELGFEHPGSGEPLRFASALPADMEVLVEALQPKMVRGKRKN